MKRLLLFALLPLIGCSAPSKIDRTALLERNNPHLTALDTLASLTVGNGGFATTVDVTGLQTFPELYSHGVPLGTQSDWGWHSFANPEQYRHEETLRDYDFGRGRTEPYATQPKEGRGKGAADWYRANPHRLHLGTIGFAEVTPEQIASIDQQLALQEGVIYSSFTIDAAPVRVETCASPTLDCLAAHIEDAAHHPLLIRFPYPTGAHSDDGCDWLSDEKHHTELIASSATSATLRRTLDETTYYLHLKWEGEAQLTPEGPNSLRLTPTTDQWSILALYSPDQEVEPFATTTFADVATASRDFWHRFWNEGGIVDFGRCTDPRAAELERRVLLSQYLLAAQCAGDTPPQETGLTYNSWFGKFHLEMILWHQAQFALFGHEELLERSLAWYQTAAPIARQIAQRQGYQGLRWMKMTDPSAMEAPSKTGSFLIWQQPHLIYLAELCYRANPREELLQQYGSLIDQTATFMADFADYNAEADRYELRGIIPAQETLRAAETINPPFELAYWRFGLELAQQWRERLGQERNEAWDEVIAKLSPLAAKDGLYLAAETAPQTYEDIRFTSDHMAVLGAYGILPDSPLFEAETMHNTLNWVCENWNWNKTWGWDYPTTAMCAVRLGEPEKALDAILMQKRTNTYLPNGHNYQDERLRCYLPGNGGLLMTVALMCAGWDGCTVENPGFPKDGTWEVRWEGIQPLP